MIPPPAMNGPMPWWAWAGFLGLIAGVLALDLGLFNRGSRIITIRKALAWCAVSFALALGFDLFVAARAGGRPALEFLTGYLVELCLSTDNIFVFIVIFRYFHVDPRHQHRALVWGVVGAVVTRGLFIFAGVGLINAFQWVIYVFGAFLVYTGFKLALPRKSDSVAVERNPAVRLVRRFLPVTDGFEGGAFFTRREGRWHATPLLVVLLAIETTDVMFALDSIPAVIAITRNEFIIFTSNIFAILGLRSLYFAVAGVMEVFRFLKYGLATVVGFVGVKMLASHYVDLPIGQSLAIIGAVLTASVLASILIPAKSR